MAVTRGKSPVMMTAAADVLTPARGAAEAQTNRIHWKVTEIRVVNGANAGDVVLKDASGGREIFRKNSLAANGETGTHFGEEGIWMDDIYVDTLPTGAAVYVYYC